MLLSRPVELRMKWQSEAWRDPNSEERPTTEEVEQALASLQPIFAEVHAMAVSEDFLWDHRIRDLRGIEIYSYLLPDVQESRTLARLLALRIRYQLSQHDFNGAIESISDGLRLAEFLAQGETLIQRLVAIACASIMRDSIKEAVSTPGCPNLYWALAGLRRPLVPVHDSVLWELRNIHRALPELAEAETALWSEAQAMAAWENVVDSLRGLGAFGAQGLDQSVVALVAVGFTQVDSARERLESTGEFKGRLEQMPSLQIVLADASRQIRRMADELGKGYLLPSAVSADVRRRASEKYQRWVARDNPSVGGLLMPAVAQADEAMKRVEMNYNRLMTLEALRMHVAVHGQLPESLSDLDPVPAMPDPYTGELFEYQKESTAMGTVVILRAAGPQHYRPMQELRIRFLSP